MRALLLIAHGSRREVSSLEVRELAERVAHAAARHYDLVVPAFLEVAEPDIRAGVVRCATAGATHVSVVPYFLSAGRHVTRDIPQQLARAKREYPGVVVQQKSYLGRHHAIPGVLPGLALEGPDAQPR